MKLEELRANLKVKETEVRSYLDAQDADKAEETMKEVRNLKKLISIEEEREEEEKRSLEKQKTKNNEPTESEFRSIVKQVMGEELSTEERASVKTVDNSAVIPKQFVNQLIEIQKGYGSLKGLCDIIPVFKNEGTIPVVDLDQNEMKDVAEGADIIDGTLVTTDVSFKCRKVGLIQSLTSELVDDAEVEIEGLVKKNFANIATVKENKAILDVIVKGAADVTATGYEDIEIAIDKSLPSVKAGLSTLVNASTYAFIKNQKDKQGRNLDLITVVNGVEHFHSKPIFTVDDELLTVTEGKTCVAYILNFKEAVKFCDRKAVTIARSTEAGFRDDTVKLRILERFDVISGAKRSIKKLEW